MKKGNENKRKKGKEISPISFRYSTLYGWTFGTTESLLADKRSSSMVVSV